MREREKGEKGFAVESRCETFQMGEDGTVAEDGCQEEDEDSSI